MVALLQQPAMSAEVFGLHVSAAAEAVDAGGRLATVTRPGLSARRGGYDPISQAIGVTAELGFGYLQHLDHHRPTPTRPPISQRQPSPGELAYSGIAPFIGTSRSSKHPPHHPRVVVASDQLRNDRRPERVADRATHRPSPTPGRYLTDSRAHPGKMLPAIAAQAITTYTQPGDLVIDPMCGSGTTLVEAIHHDRQAIGIEYEPAWAQLSRDNITHAQAAGATGTAAVHTGDARTHPRPTPTPNSPQRGQRAALVLTSPPYGPSVHGQVKAIGIRPVEKSYDRYSTDRANLAHQPHHDLIDGFTDILTKSRRAPRTWRHRRGHRPALPPRRTTR